MLVPCLLVYSLPTLCALYWLGRMVHRRRMALRELLLFVAYIAFLIAFYWQVVPAVLRRWFSEVFAF
jgi:hypothetical protein